MPRRKAATFSRRQLVAEFKKLGVEDPAGWAASEVDEGLPQLATACFARLLWATAERNQGWISQLLKVEHDDAVESPGAPAAQAVRAMLDRGVSRKQILELVRYMQVFSLHRLANILGGNVEIRLPFDAFSVVASSSRNNYEDAVVVDFAHEVLWSLVPPEYKEKPAGPKKKRTKPR